MRAGSAPIPNTPRLPPVRISKSRPSRPTPKASRAWRSASSTDFPVNSWYELIAFSLVVPGGHAGPGASSVRRTRPVKRPWIGHWFEARTLLPRA